MGRDRARDLALAQPVAGMVLVVHHEVVEQPRQGLLRPGQRRQEPRGQAVRVHRDPHGALPLTGFGQIPQGLRLHQRHILGMAGQAVAQGGAQAGRAAQHQRLAHAVLQRADPLRDRRLRHPKNLRRAVEGPDTQ